MEKYDAIIIGSGQGGTPLAGALARAGKKTALVERAHVGGTCINEGCTPTKTMVASARVAYLARRGEDFGIQVENLRIDMKIIRRRKRDIVESFRSGSENRIQNQENLDLLRGDARFNGPKSLVIKRADSKTFDVAAEWIFINTGTRPAVPKIEGLAGVPYLDSTSIMECDRVPKHLIIVGGGYIGLEFGQMFRRFGSRVTIVQRGEQLLSREDRDVADEVLKILRDDGIEIYLNSETRSVGKDRAGSVSLTIGNDSGEHTISGSHLLIAAGRTANTDELDLEKAGVETDKRGFIRVDERLQTRAPGVYAVGDVKGGPAFTHISYDDYRILEMNLLKNGKATTTGRLVPYTVYIDPQLGRVGLSESDAKSSGIKYLTAKMPMSWVARALETDESRGFMKILIDPRTEGLLGCAVLGLEGGELMSALQIAMIGNIPYTRLRDAVFAHPTLAESFNNLFAGVSRAVPRMI